VGLVAGAQGSDRLGLGLGLYIARNAMHVIYGIRGGLFGAAGWTCGTLLIR
jgi:hypothetical protein